MADKSPSALWDKFFSLESSSDFIAFKNNLNPNAPDEAALIYYSSTWNINENHSGNFVPEAFISKDLSVVMLYSCPVIFMGTNSWAEKPYSVARSSLDVLNRHIKKLKSHFHQSAVVMVIVPEKDFVIDYLFLGENRYGRLVDALRELRDDLSRDGIPLIFDQPLKGMEAYQSLSDFAVPDSHLPGRNYIQIFHFILKNFDISWKKVSPYLSMKSEYLYGDMFGRLANSPTEPQLEHTPFVPKSDISIKCGSTTFESPLGDTYQELINNNYIFDESLLILGDSHSSILDQKRLTYLLSSVFKETIFSWNPCAIRTGPPNLHPKYVVLEVSMRFVF